jgi:KUP system potassium uptake protein
MSIPTAAAATAHTTNSRRAKLVLGALGVVYGDIGTSPIYTLRECLLRVGSEMPVQEAVLGVLSLMFWALVFVVTLKYVIIVMRADNRGEGGILSLLALAQRTMADRPRAAAAAVLIGLTGAALFFGDAVITPAISVLSAVEGIAVAAPTFEPWIVPVALVILVVLFALQPRGTGQLGLFFGPVILIWFTVLAVLGVVAIVETPSVLAALDPSRGLYVLLNHPRVALPLLGTVVLVFTGAEALYADMGHFGRKPIRLAWLAFVFPALALNYFGQGASVIADPDKASQPFFLLAPAWGLIPLIIVTTAATIIAAQATISGAFSMTQQAMQLGYLPRFRVVHTSETETGQIYIARINWLLLAAVIWLVLEFGSSGALASAYGIAVTGTMLCTTLLGLINYRRFGLSIPVILGLMVWFLFLDIVFLGSNLLKVADGGWFPLSVGAIVLTLMLTWHKGRRLIVQQQGEEGLSEEQFLGRVRDGHPERVPGTAVFLTASDKGIPAALLHNLKHNHVLHMRVLLLTVDSDEHPRLREEERLSVTPLQKGFFRVHLRYGFMETPDVPRDLELLRRHGIAVDMMEMSYFLSRENVVRGRHPLLSGWRRWVFAFLQRNAETAADYFRLPPNRVVELGSLIGV